MDGKQRFILSAFFLFLIALTVNADSDTARFASWPSSLNKMRAGIVDGSLASNSKTVDLFMLKARNSKKRDCISWAFYYKIFYYTVMSPDITIAEKSLQQMEKEKMYERDVNKAKSSVIYYYQMIGKSAKAVALCREILNTTHDKTMMAEANYNILLLYQNLNLFEEAARRGKEFCRFSESITGKDIYHYDLANFYSCTADYLVELGRADEALYYLHKTDSTIAHDGEKAPSSGGYDMRFVTATWGKYYLLTGCDAKFWSVVQKLRTYGSEPLLGHSYELEARYYLKYGNYAKAKEAVDSMTEVFRKFGQNFGGAQRTLMCARIAHGMGDYRSACNLYKLYAQKSDSLNRQADEFQTNEYAVQLNLNKADIEKSEYKAEANRYRYQLLFVIVIVISLIFVASVFVILYLRKINAKLKFTNKRLNIAFMNVDKLSKMKSLFIDNMSHEIRTPLNSIVGFSELLETGDEEQQKFTDIIKKNSQQLLKIVENVLDLSDVQSRDIAMEPTDVNDCCESALNSVRSRLSEDVRLIYEPSDKNLIVSSSVIGLKKVISNLLDNSVKFTTHGTITLSYFVEGSELHITVKDTGSGVPSDKVDYVFGRFVKLDDFSLGGGLGLTICQLIIAKMGGRISIDKEYHEGCKVDVVI